VAGTAREVFRAFAGCNYERGTKPGHSKSLQQETTIQLQQAYSQAALAHRERVQQIEGLQSHRNLLPQAGGKLSGLCLPRRLDLMSLHPTSRDI